MWNIFTKKKTDVDKLGEKLVKSLLSEDNLKKLLADAKKQWDFEELQTHPLNYPIIQDLLNSAQAGILIEVNFPDGAKFTIKQDPDHMSPEAMERLQRAQRQENKEYF